MGGCDLAVGQRGIFRLGDEDDYKVRNSPLTMYNQFMLNEDVQSVRALLENAEMRGDGQTSKPFRDNFVIGGPFVPTLHFDAIGHSLKYAFGTVTTIAQGTAAAAVYTGSGSLDDATFSGSYSGTDRAQIEIIVSLSAATDEFDWRINTINSVGTVTNGTWTTGVAMTGAAQVLGSTGVSVTFAAITGHDDTGPPVDGWTSELYGQYHHTFKIATALPYFICEREFQDISKTIINEGCLMDQFAFDWNTAGGLSFNTNIIGSKPTPGVATVADTVVSYTSVAQSQLQIEGVDEGGALNAQIEGFSLSLANSTDGIYYLDGTGEFGCLKRTRSRITGTLTEGFVDDTINTKGLNDTESSLRVGVANGDEFLQFYIPELVYEFNYPTLNTPDIVRNPHNWEGFLQDDAEGSQIIAPLFNSVSSY